MSSIFDVISSSSSHPLLLLLLLITLRTGRSTHEYFTSTILVESKTLKSDEEWQNWTNHCTSTSNWNLLLLELMFSQQHGCPYISAQRNTYEYSKDSRCPCCLYLSMFFVVLCRNYYYHYYYYFLMAKEMRECFWAYSSTSWVLIKTLRGGFGSYLSRVYLNPSSSLSCCCLIEYRPDKEIFVVNKCNKGDDAG